MKSLIEKKSLRNSLRNKFFFKYNNNEIFFQIYLNQIIELLTR